MYQCAVVKHQRLEKFILVLKSHTLTLVNVMKVILLQPPLQNILY